MRDIKPIITIHVEFWYSHMVYQLEVFCMWSRQLLCCYFIHHSTCTSSISIMLSQKGSSDICVYVQISPSCVRLSIMSHTLIQYVFHYGLFQSRHIPEIWCFNFSFLGSILCERPTNERRCLYMTQHRSLVGRTHRMIPVFTFRSVSTIHKAILYYVLVNSKIMVNLKSGIDQHGSLLFIQQTCLKTPELLQAMASVLNRLQQYHKYSLLMHRIKIKSHANFCYGINKTFLWVDLSFINQTYSGGITTTKTPTGYWPWAMSLYFKFRAICFWLLNEYQWWHQAKIYHIIRQLSYRFMCEIRTWSDDKTKLIHKNISASSWTLSKTKIPITHRENSPVTQTTPEPTLLIWGGWPRAKNFPHPWLHCQTRSYRAYRATKTPLFSNPLMSPFDTQVYHEHQICLRFHRILKVILEMAFSAHCTPIWKLNRISTTIINRVTRKCIWCCHRAQRCMTSPWLWGKIVQWSVKVWSR